MKCPSLLVKIVLIILIFVASIILHEGTHGVIYRGYGCENVTYGADISGFFTIADCEITRDYSVSLRHAHAMNEIIGYNIVSLLVVIITLLIMYDGTKYY